MAKRTTTFSMRMPDDLNERIQEYANTHNCTKAEAMSHFARAGIELEDNGGLPAAKGDGADAAAAVDTEALARIEKRLEALQNLPTIEPDNNSLVVPLDIRDKIHAYSIAHECTEYDALLYYARIGVQMTGNDRAASVSDLAELGRRIDTLAQDAQVKTEQMRQMAEAIITIRDYTKPGEIVIDGEVAADGVVEVSKIQAMSEEERQKMEDERTRRVVNEAMGEYFAHQREAQSVSAMPQKKQKTSPAVPVLIIIIVGLICSLAYLILQQYQL